MSSTPVADRTQDLPESVRDHPVVVGIDGTPHSSAALDWAVAEAATLGRRVELLHAHSRGVAGHDAVTPLRASVEDRVLVAALARVATHAGAPAVRGHSVGGHAVDLLVDASRDATAVVVGAPRHGPVARVVVGSTAVEVAARAECAVVVVRDGFPGRPHGGIVVGSDGSDVSCAAIGDAFRRAARTGQSLTVVHTWYLDYAGPTFIVPELEVERRRAGERERAVTEKTVAAWSQEYPEVVVHPHVVHGDPVHVLADLSAEAEVLVVGSHARGELAGLVLGSVSQALLRRAGCPVMVVRPDPRSADRTAKDAR